MCGQDFAAEPHAQSWHLIAHRCPADCIHSADLKLDDTDVHEISALTTWRLASDWGIKLACIQLATSRSTVPPLTLFSPSFVNGSKCRWTGEDCLRGKYEKRDGATG